MEDDQFVQVQKGGQPGRLHKTTWKRIGEHNNKEGWILVPSEVNDIREKKISSQLRQEPSYQNEPVTVAKNEPVDEQAIIKVKKKPGRPKVEK